MTKTYTREYLEQRRQAKGSAILESRNKPIMEDVSRVQETVVGDDVLGTITRSEKTVEQNEREREVTTKSKTATRRKQTDE